MYLYIVYLKKNKEWSKGWSRFSYLTMTLRMRIHISPFTYKWSVIKYILLLWRYMNKKYFTYFKFKRHIHTSSYNDFRIVFSFPGKIASKNYWNFSCTVCHKWQKLCILKDFGKSILLIPTRLLCMIVIVSLVAASQSCI